MRLPDTEYFFSEFYYLNVYNIIFIIIMKILWSLQKYLFEKSVERKFCGVTSSDFCKDFVMQNTIIIKIKKIIFLGTFIFD